MQITLTLPESIIFQLQRQAAQLDVSVDDLALKLFSKALNDDLVEATSPAGHYDDGLPSLEEVVAIIKATPPNPDAIIHPTKTIEEVLAHWEAIAPDESDITPDDMNLSLLTTDKDFQAIPDLEQENWLANG